MPYHHKGEPRGPWTALVNSSDIVGFDCYPFGAYIPAPEGDGCTEAQLLSGRCPRNMTTIGHAIDSITSYAPAAGKPVWVVLQAFGNAEVFRRSPSSQEERAFTYLSIVHGASGVLYFARDGGLGSIAGPERIEPSSTTLWGECRRLALEFASLRQLGALRPAASTSLDMQLLSAGTVAGAEPSDGVAHVHASVREDRCGGIIVLLVNTLNAPAAVTVQLLRGANVLPYTGTTQVAFDNRELVLSNGRMSDTLEGFGRRVLHVPHACSPSETTQVTLNKRNLIVNPSFEGSVNTGVPYAFELYDQGDHGANAFRDASTSVHGMHSLRLRTPEDARGVQADIVPLHLPDGVYNLSLCAKGSAAATEGERPLRLRIVLSCHMDSSCDPHAPPLANASFELQSQWTLFAAPLFRIEPKLGDMAAPSTKQVRASLELETQGVAWVDLVQLVPA
eukprot:SAG31_NODE_4651_length_3068_cov_1.991580_2_plen_449_part_00